MPCIDSKISISDRVTTVIVDKKANIKDFKVAPLAILA